MKSNRTLIILVLAVALMAVVMTCSVVITTSGLAGREKVAAQPGWKLAANTATSLNITDLTNDGQRDVFVQDSYGIKILDTQGQTILDQPMPSPMASTLGNLNADDAVEIITYTYNGERAVVTAFTGQGQNLWTTQLANLGEPGRAAAVDFERNRQSEVVVADATGRVVALNSQGQELWRYSGLSGVIRGLDTTPLEGGDVVALGDESGPVVALNGQGQELWRTDASGGLRRLRAFPLGGPLAGKVLVGSVAGQLTVHQADTGQIVWEANLGQAVNEIRPVEVDGNPATSEVMVGGKDGGVWAYSQDGQQLWSASVDDKVSELASVSGGEGSGPVILVGDESGKVRLYDRNGLFLNSIQGQGAIERIETGRLPGGGFLIADSGQVTLYTLTKETAPFWYTPILGGVLACLAIAVVAYFIASMKPAPTLRVSAEGMTVEAQNARRRLLHESITDLKKIQQRGEVSGEAYLARIRELREQLAQVNEALIKSGEPIKPESFACPHCHGPLELGTDRCEFCGQVVIV
jgi:outer membrane protein assembly factor BamB